MPYEDPLFLTRPHERRVQDGSNRSGNPTSVGGTAYRSLNTEDISSSVSLPEEDLHTAIVVPPLACDHLVDHQSTSSSNDNNNNNGCFVHNQSGSDLKTRVPSPQLPSASPCTNAPVHLPGHPTPRRSLRHEGGSDNGGGSVCGSVSDLCSSRTRHDATPASAAGNRPRLIDNFPFNLEIGTENQNQQSHYNIHVDNSSPKPPAAVAYPAENSSPSRDIFHRLLLVIMPSVTAFLDRVHHMTWKQILWVALLVALVMVGNFMQIVMLNFWLISFPRDGTPGNYTAFSVPGIFFAILFALLCGAYAVIRRPSLRFATHLHGWGILLGVGFCDAFNSWMATYAASNTSEVLQALFTNLCPLYAVFLSKWILRDTRRYANIYIASVFVLTILGILAASLYGLIKDRNMSEGKWWILILFLSMPVRVLMNVWQSLYMIVYTRDSKFVSWLRDRFAEETPTTVEVGEGEGEDGGSESAATTDKVKKEGVCRPRHPPSSTSLETDSPAATVNALRDELDRGAHGDGAEEPHDAVYIKKKKKLHRKEDSFAVAGEPDSDPSLPATSVTTPTETANEHNNNNNHHFDSVHKSLHSHKKSSKDASDLHAMEDTEKNCGGGHAVPSSAADHPVVAMQADAVQDEDEKYLYSSTAAAAPPLPTQTMFTVRYNQGEDTIVKLVMLAGETFIQMCFTLSLLPADALPWWGNSATVDATWHNFKEGIRCVFTIRENFLYCFLYTLGFVFTYVGCAYLNHYSAALCSIVSQLSSPVTALMLVIVPSWNVQEDGDSPWYCNVIAIVFLCIAALLYVLWEEMTDHEKVQAEYALKIEQLHVRPSSHEKPHSVVIVG